VAAGMLWPLGWVDAWGGGPWPLTATFTAPAAAVLAVWAMYRYPDPSLVGRSERRYLVLLAGWALVGRMTNAVVAEPGWKSCVTGACAADAWWPTLWADAGLERVTGALSGAGEALLGLAFLVQWFRRNRRATGLDRRLMLPVATAGVVAGAAAAMPAVGEVLGVPGATLNLLYAVQSAALIAVPCAFLGAVLRRRLAGNAIGRLIQHLDQGTAPHAVQEALRIVFGDPGLRVHLAGGDPVDPVHDPMADGPERLTIPVTSSTGEALAVIEADPSIGHHHDLVASAVAAARFALENERLHEALRLQLEQVQASRLRIVDAAMTERRTLERDLHDGAQQRLLAIKLRLAAAHHGHGELDPGVRAVLAELRDEIGHALDELRDLARGLHPAVLSQSGIAAAVEGVAENHSLPVSVDLPARRFPPPTEATAYFVVCEALTNITRHAQATHVRVEGRQQHDDLIIHIRDDGRGGADPNGHGLTGLQDRVRAIGGDLEISSPAGGGTLLSARIPCA
jgi:signal transduction histidine kinase